MRTAAVVGSRTEFLNFYLLQEYFSKFRILIKTVLHIIKCKQKANLLLNYAFTFIS